MTVCFLPPMQELLERAGFRVRGRRADCVRCSGSSRLTVSFTDEVSYCHRCHWTANTVTLAREQGLLNNPEARAHYQKEWEKRAKHESVIREFETWRDARIREASDRHRVLWQKAGLAHRVLQEFPEEDSAWDDLARFYHSRADLSTTLDFLTCAKASDWLEQDASIEDVFSIWEHRRAA